MKFVFRTNDKVRVIICLNQWNKEVKIFNLFTEPSSTEQPAESQEETTEEKKEKTEEGETEEKETKQETTPEAGEDTTTGAEEGGNQETADPAPEDQEQSAE